MIIFTREKYVPTDANIIQLAIPDQGFVLMGIDLYRDLILTQPPNIDPEDIYNHVDIFGWFRDIVPEPLDSLALLIDLLDFEVPEDLEIIFGCFSTILKFRDIPALFTMFRDEFLAIKLSSFVMKEYLVPRQTFLAQCLKYSDLIGETPPQQYSFLYLSPVSPDFQTFSTASSTVVPQVSETVEEPDDYHYYIDHKDSYNYFGGGTFYNLTSHRMIQLDDYDESEINKAFGLEVAESSSAPEVPTTPEPATVPAASTVELTKEEEDNRTSVANIFKTSRGR